jgi:hypothetical protein
VVRNAADCPVEAVMDAVGVQQAVKVAADLGQLRVGGETARASQQRQELPAVQEETEP